MTGPQRPADYDFIIHRMINAVAGMQVDAAGQSWIPISALGNPEDLIPILLEPADPRFTADPRPMFSAAATLISYLTAALAAERGISPEEQIQRIREKFLPPVQVQDPVLQSFLKTVRSAAATAEPYVDRVVYAASGSTMPNLVIVTTWADGEQDTNLVEALCAVGKLWAMQNAPGGLTISVAPLDYSTSWTHCTYP